MLLLGLAKGGGHKGARTQQARRLLRNQQTRPSTFSLTNFPENAPSENLAAVVRYVLITRADRHAKRHETMSRKCQKTAAASRQKEVKRQPLAVMDRKLLEDETKQGASTRLVRRDAIACVCGRCVTEFWKRTYCT